LPEVIVVLGREADDEVGSERPLGELVVERRHDLVEFVGGMLAAHVRQHVGAA
jgi:hypothetical protein